MENQKADTRQLNRGRTREVDSKSTESKEERCNIYTMSSYIRQNNCNSAIYSRWLPGFFLSFRMHGDDGDDDDDGDGDDGDALQCVAKGNDM